MPTHGFGFNLWRLIGISSIPRRFLAGIVPPVSDETGSGAGMARAIRRHGRICRTGRYLPLAIRPIKAHAAKRSAAHQRAVELRDGTENT
jgi:hypothetical protein